MGLDFLRAKEQRFVQKRDASKSKELSMDMFGAAKGDAHTHLFRCVLTDAAAQLPAGIGAIARVMSETTVVIVQHAREVGHVVSEDVAALIEAMKKNHRHGGVLSVIVVEEPDFNGEFTVRSKTPLR